MHHLNILLVLALLLSGCNQQRGNFIVTSRKSSDWRNAGGGCEMLFGYSDKDRKNTVLLLAYVMIDQNADSKKRNFNGDDGIFVSATNISYNGDGPTFHVGSGWNRNSNVVVVDDKEFDRMRGNVFVILRAEGRTNKMQVPGNCSAEAPSELLEYVRDNADLGSAYNEVVDRIVPD
jgi:hypothetical protein